ncbi:MAG: tetratricopeptide repeat protein [Candidatus Accumulibacter sp.]|nr:tetratricopeptide repeat protein [Accumulibacter sp.]
MRSIPRKSLPNRLPAMIAGLLLVAGASLAKADNLPEAQRLSKQGQWPQALQKVDAYLADQPKDAQGRFLRGVILAEMGRSGDAIVVFSKLAEDYPELPEPYNNLAVLYAQKKQYDKARTALEMAIRTHPSYSTAHENLGDVYAKLASQAYDKALQLDSSNKVTQSKLSMIRELIGSSSAAGARPAAPAPAAGESGRLAAVDASRVPLAAMPPAAVPAAPSAVAPAVVAAATPAVRPAEQKATEKSAEKPHEKAAEKPLAAARSEAAGTPEKRPAQAAQVVTAAASEPPKSAPAVLGGDDDAAVNKVLQAWADAWSRKDVAAYLGHYAADFDTPRGMSRKAWDAQRHQRIDKPGKLQVEIEDVRISFADHGDRATARFKQRYTSAALKSTVGKTLVLVKRKGKWLIVQERVGS